MARHSGSLDLPQLSLLMAGYFVCGFQVMFIGVHMPSYLKDFGMAPMWPAIRWPWSACSISSAPICLAGNLGQKRPLYLLSGIYGLRSVAHRGLLLARSRPGRSMPSAPPPGFLWLSTVLTNATIAQIFGVAASVHAGRFYLFSHQIGSFLGVWWAAISTTSTATTTWSGTSRLPWAFCRRRQPPCARQPLCDARPAPPDTEDTTMQLKLWQRIPSGVPCMGLLLAVFALYLQPEFMVTPGRPGLAASSSWANRPGGMAGREHGPHHHHRSLGRHRRRNGPPAGTNP